MNIDSFQTVYVFIPTANITLINQRQKHARKQSRWHFKSMWDGLFLFCLAKTKNIKIRRNRQNCISLFGAKTDSFHFNAASFFAAFHAQSIDDSTIGNATYII